MLGDFFGLHLALAATSSIVLEVDVESVIKLIVIAEESLISNKHLFVSIYT